MVVYEFYYKDILIGHLQIENGLHHYIPIAEAVQPLRERVPLLREMVEGYPWGKPIPFFKERIENATRFGMEKCIRYHTDLFLMRMISE